MKVFIKLSNIERFEIPYELSECIPIIGDTIDYDYKSVENGIVKNLNLHAKVIDRVFHIEDGIPFEINQKKTTCTLVVKHI